MKHFIAIDEQVLLALWIHAPHAVVPFSRPFCTRLTPAHRQAIQAQAEALVEECVLAECNRSA